MRSASYPTPAQLDAYAKKVANSPLTIQIFPNSVKVPQRKHIRRTVNGLDTSSGQRHCPYPSQVCASGGLLAVLCVPVKGVTKESLGSRGPQPQKAAMNPHSGPYATQSTLNTPQPAPHLQVPPQAVGPPVQKQGMVHPRALQQQQHSMSLSLAPTPQQRNVVHSQLQRQQSLSQVQTSQQRLVHTQVPQRQQSLQQQPQQQHHHPPPPHLTLKPPPPSSQALLTQPGVPQDLCLLSDGAPLSGLQHGPALNGSQSVPPLPMAAGAGPQTLSNSLQQPPPGGYGPRKLPDADAPPNVTVSTSTIPLSMAASLHQNRAGDLSSIVLQINQLCQARAGAGGTSVCEGQIANPSPISRNLLINASTRVSSHHHPHPAPGPGCLLVGPPDKAAAPSATLHTQPGVSATNSVPTFHHDVEKVQLQQQQLQHHLQQKQQQQLQHLQQQQLQQQQHSWAQHQLAHMQQPPEDVHPCKAPRMEPSADCSFPPRPLNYTRKLPGSAQPKPRPPSPLGGPIGAVPAYVNGHYLQPSWGSVPAAGNNGSCRQDVPPGFQGGQCPPTTTTGRIPGAKYRPGKDGLGPTKLLPPMDFLGGDFQMPVFPEPNMDVLEKMHSSAGGQVPDPGSGAGVLGHHHPGYR